MRQPGCEVASAVYLTVCTRCHRQEWDVCKSMLRLHYTIAWLHRKLATPFRPLLKIGSIPSQRDRASVQRSEWILRGKSECERTDVKRDIRVLLHAAPAHARIFALRCTTSPDA